MRLLGNATFHRAFSPRVSSTTLALTWLAAGRRAAYLHEGDLRDNVHFAAPIAIARAAGCVVTGVHGQPLHRAHGLLAAAEAATHASLLALLDQPAREVHGRSLGPSAQRLSLDVRGPGGPGTGHAGRLGGPWTATGHGGSPW